jgi:hypothetical protein
MNALNIVLVALALTGCGQVDSVANRFKSSTGMLERTVTIYDANGKPIKSWVTDNQIEYGGPVAGFIDKNGLNVRISRTFIIEGK